MGRRYTGIPPFFFKQCTENIEYTDIPIILKIPKYIDSIEISNYQKCLNMENTEISSVPKLPYQNIG